jgi:hypothetical protein
VRAVTLVLGEHEASVATDDALAEVSTIHESAHAETRERLAALFDVVTRAAAEKHLEPVLAYTDELGDPTAHCPRSGELQTAINALEEQLRRAVLDDALPDLQGHGLGVVLTILGAVKDRLACDYDARVGRQGCALFASRSSSAARPAHPGP